MEYHRIDFIGLFLLGIFIYCLTPWGRKQMPMVVKTALAVSGIFLLLPVLAWTILGLSALSGSNPPKPEIKQAEFPFALEYRINEEDMGVEDTLVCKYTGWAGDFEVDGKKRRTWSSHYRSGNESIILLEQREVEKAYNEDLELLEEGSYSVKVCLHFGSARYYMGDPDAYEQARATIEIQVKDENGHMVYRESLAEDEWLNSPQLAAYGIQLVSWELPEPIENTFH